LTRLGRLAAQPAFRHDPLRVMLRAGSLAAHVGLRRSPVFRLTRGGERLRTPADLRYTTVTAYLLRDWVEPELRALDQLLQLGDVFIDVGANIGLYTLKAARLVGATGKVLALEPGREAFAQLQANLALNAFPWVTTLREAASDHDGAAVLHHVPLGDDPQAFSLIAHPLAVEGETVAVRRLDAIAMDAGLERIDLIKIDVEGAEPQVLDGMAQMLTTTRPAVLFECNAHLNAGGMGGAAVGAFGRLAAYGYNFYRLVDGHFVPVFDPPSDFCNVLACHPSRRAPFAR
jgi:FkbM family methyltransferase